MVARYVQFVFILLDVSFPGCHFSDSMGPAHCQLLLAGFQLAGRESLFFSSSQHLSSALAGMLADRCVVVLLVSFLSFLLLLLVCRLTAWFLHVVFYE
jgi:hypothetical protein